MNCKKIWNWYQHANFSFTGELLYKDCTMASQRFVGGDIGIEHPE